MEKPKNSSFLLVFLCPFYLWPRVDHLVAGSGDVTPDEAFTTALFAEQAVKVVPGSYLSRTGDDGVNPGHGRVRLALVAPVEECVTAAKRIATLQPGTADGIRWNDALTGRLPLA